MKILFVASWFPTESNPVFGSFIKEQADLMHGHGHNVTVLHVYMHGGFLHSLLKKGHTKVSKVKEPYCVLRVSGRHLYPFMRSVSYRKLCKSSLSAVQPLAMNCDVVHSHAMFMGGYVARFISTACRKPMLHTEHASELAGESFHPTIHELQSARDVFGESDCIAFVSQASRERTLSRLHIRLSPKHIVIGNLIREDLFSFDGQGMKLRGACSRFIAIGNFVRVKGFDVLLKAWRRHVHRFPNCMLTLAGSGPEREALVELCKELKIENSVEFIGRLERREVREQLQIHDVLVSSSIVETFGMVVAEAIACGIPVVCTNSGGVNDFVNESNGILADANEISLADALNHMMTMYSSYDRKRMSRTILDQYGSEMFYSNLLEAYNRAISNYC